MKKFYFLLIILTIGLTTWAQTTRTWNGGSGAWNVPGNWSPGGIPVAGDRIQFSDGNTATITNVPTLSVSDISVSNNTNITLQHTSAAALTVTNGFGTDFSINAGSTLVIGNNVNIITAADASTSISGTLTINPGRNFSIGSGGAVIDGIVNVNGTIDNNGAYDTNSGSVTNVTGTFKNGGSITDASAARLKFQTGGSYSHDQNGGTVPDATWDIASLCNITGMTTAYPNGMDQNFGSVTFSSTISDDVEMSGNLTCRQNLTIAIGFGTGDNFSVTESNQNRTITVGGKFTLSSGIFVLDNDNGGSQLNVAGDFVLSGGTLTENSSGTVEVNFNGTTVQTFVKSLAATISENIDFTINSNAKVDFGTSVLDGSDGAFTLSNGGKIITAHANGLGATGSVQMAASFGSGADYEFQGGSTGSFTTTGNQVRDLVINNATTTEVMAARNFVVTRALTLTNGYLTTTAGQVTIGTSGNASTSNGAFVNGPLSKNTNTNNASFTFPVGKVDGGLRTIGITTTSNNSSTFTAQFFRSSPATGTLGTGIAKVSGCEYWDLARLSGSAPVRVILSWASGSACNGAYITDPTALRVAHLLGGTWVNEGRQTSTGDNNAGTITSSVAINSFSPFALASSSIDANPLPVVFGDVKAYESNNGVQVEWSNLTEKDVADYTLEHSTDGRSFSGIAEQLPTSNQNDRADYISFDADPDQGTNYYRIKAVETTGKVVYSKVLSVNLGQANKGMKLYPNPVSGNQVTISLSNVIRGQYSLRVVNTAGQDIYKQSISTQGSTTTQTIDLPASIKPGVYSMIVTGSNYRENKMFIVQ